ncbi:putative metal-dependent hydrolase [Pyrodictium delaneyi]|nr:putative metal-dependent hydrolase [Pyrodictium delaneyi]
MLLVYVVKRIVRLRIVDLTRPLSPETRVYPGDPPVRIEAIADIEKDGYYNRLLHVHEHVGTHVDAPAHMIQGGATIDMLEPARLVAPAVVMDLSNACGPVTSREIIAALRLRRLPLPQNGWYLLLRIGGGCRSISIDAAEWMVRMKLAGLGVDAASPDGPPYNVHRVLLSSNMLIIENLNIPSMLDGEIVTIVVAPLLVKGGSGAPARVYALLDGGRLGKWLRGEQV